VRLIATIAAAVCAIAAHATHLAPWHPGVGDESLVAVADGSRLIQRVSSFATTSFTYDALGNRVRAGGRIWIPDYDDPLKRPILECDEDGMPVRAYIWGAGRRNMTVPGVKWCIGPLAQGGEDIGIAVFVSPESAEFSKAGFEYMTSQNSVPWVLIRSVSGGAP